MAPTPDALHRAPRGPASIVVRGGRPQRVDDAGVATRERLLVAAAEACVEHGYEGATVADIARRAEVSAPAIYNHFGGKAELLVAAGRWALDRLQADRGAGLTASAVAHAFLADSFAANRRLLSELHLAGQRRPEVAELLADWHRDHAMTWRPYAIGRQPDATVRLFFALLLGLCQIDSLVALPCAPSTVSRLVDDMLCRLFTEEPVR